MTEFPLLSLPLITAAQSDQGGPKVILINDMLYDILLKHHSKA
ncbi:MAG: hypothetical protein WAZ77_02890 [Candidatus Nitrosopolaris sp.]